MRCAALTGNAKVALVLIKAGSEIDAVDKFVSNVFVCII